MTRRSDNWWALLHEAERVGQLSTELTRQAERDGEADKHAQRR
ncbi:hypothetical protein AB0942_09400 [Streptomyces nodosus]